MTENRAQRLSALTVLLVVGCAMDEWLGPEPVALEEFASAHQEWRTKRRDRLVRPQSGPVLWIGLWELPQLPEYFPLDTAWRVTARFEPYPEPRPLPVWDVVRGTIEYETPGELVFRKNGREHRLIAVAGANSSRYFIMMWDSTATSSTYQGGRYLGVPFADEDGWTTIDFNRTYNAPCVFSPYSTCALPPRENRLALRISAGEKRPAKSVY